MAEISVKKQKLTVDSDGTLAGADINDDGHISETELNMHLEFRRKELCICHYG